MDNLKAVLIESGYKLEGPRFKWEKISGSIEDFTLQIGSANTSKENQEALPSITKAISGIPSAFARANMFTYAFLAAPEMGGKSGLNQFYNELLDEWKGLIAAFVLEENSTLFTVKRVELIYSKGDGSWRDSDSVYELKGAFGNSLFHKKPLWVDQDLLDEQKKGVFKPFIDIIYYNGQVVGGTSPESLVFTAPGYEILGELRNKPFISKHTGKFTDPTKINGSLNVEECKSLYAYIKKLNRDVNDFFDIYKNTEHLWFNDRLKQWIKDALKNWEKDLLKKYPEVESSNKKPEVKVFDKEPFLSLFNEENDYYADFEGNIFDEEGPNYVKFKLENLLLDPAMSKIAHIAVPEAENLPVTLINPRNTKDYFTIPLSPLGLKIFQREGLLESLIEGTGGANSHSLTSFFDAEKQELTVTLDLKKEDFTALTPISKTYSVFSKSIDPSITNHLVVWPNFASSLWQKYYFYSEMPHNNPTGFAVYPILGKINEDTNVVELLENNESGTAGSIESSPGDSIKFARIFDNDINKNEYGELLVGNIKTLSSFKYEIYESKYPIRGMEFRNSGKSAGYLFLKYSGKPSTNNHIQLIKDRHPEPCRVGIDFGSNNSCVAYEKHGTSEQKILEIRNRRVSIFKEDKVQNEDNSILPASTFEMLFFQNDSVWSNNIKSQITLHDSTRMINIKGKNQDQLYAELVKGGFTVYEKNIDLIESTDYQYFVRPFGMQDQEVEIIHSMKWKHKQEKDFNYKLSFLKNLLLQTYAELFAGISEGALYPSKVVWAYPSAMSFSRVKAYSGNVWQKLADCNPLLDKYKFHVSEHVWEDNGGTENETKSIRYPEEIVPENAWSFSIPKPVNIENALTEAQAVARYAATKSPQKGEYVIGVDVGGSTSDFLFVTGIDGKSALVNQNSIKFAAGLIADSTIYVPGIDKFLKDYAVNNKESLGGSIKALENIIESKIPFCFNQILDRLQDDSDLDQFYYEIATKAKPLFWINLYLTGLTIYYLGIVSSKVREIHNRHKDQFGCNLSQLKIEFYGKGARIFDWFKAYDKGMAKSYLETCFKNGYGQNEEEIIFTLFNTIKRTEREVKVEVAKGLAASYTKLTEFSASNMIGEISGEDGFELVGPDKKTSSYTATMEINPSLIQLVGFELSNSSSQEKYPRFTEFVKIFHKYAKSAGFNLEIEEMLSVIRGMNIREEIEKDEDFIFAREEFERGNSEFDFVAPLLILEGQAFLKSYLLPKIKNG